MNSRHLHRCVHGIAMPHGRNENQGKACRPCSAQSTRNALLHYPRLFRDWLREQIKTTDRAGWLEIIFCVACLFAAWIKS